MKDKKHRTYAKEFKLEALVLLESIGKSAAQMERNLRITKGLLLKWRDRYPLPWRLALDSHNTDGRR